MVFHCLRLTIYGMLKDAWFKDTSGGETKYHLIKYPLPPAR
jgi:hypothetical protein